LLAIVLAAKDFVQCPSPSSFTMLSEMISDTTHLTSNFPASLFGPPLLCTLTLTKMRFLSSFTSASA
jgi:hypothetical protein